MDEGWSAGCSPPITMYPTVAPVVSRPTAADELLEFLKGMIARIEALEAIVEKHLPRPEPLKTIICVKCEKQAVVKRIGARFCSKACKNAAAQARRRARLRLSL